MDEQQRIERGSCFCGKVIAAARGEPFWVNYDHDDDCRKALGGPLTVWIGYRQAQISFGSNVPKMFSKTPGVVRTFCEECGSSIGYIDQGLRDEYWLTIGFMDNPERFEPEAHSFWSMKLPWVEFADDLPRVPRYSRPRDPNVGDPSNRAKQQR
ncbi:MAG: GFA family protein [Mesorhizobium sp.]|nr:GFA family protein [bacterium M00.F.Ca.ET.205.01.1.1]TGU46684.1 GFA family protein [bacterium M00.F.Ca.ET.152.01.1.1]TGV31781.1 GFA family protein [Mesorhizobium sp. M00.F.Ca.ET.186.01.1.1]TGZ38949.1 GFA family protein [bacterium M00.F.Ca.ET.162.01.1.1]TIW63108.1 MAG: GFA family protein [Mesorhizobium sp.]